jgi:cytochrome c oxidase subunit 4
MAHPHEAHDQEHAGDFDVHAHISPAKFYVFILLVLMALTLLTVGVSYIHLGKLNLIVAIVIASIKASLVVLFFMHLRYDNKFNALVLIMSLLFIGVFFAYTLNDTDHRAEVDLESGSKVLPSTGAEAPGGFEGHHAAAPGGSVTPGASAAPAGDHGAHAPEPAPHH